MKKSGWILAFALTGALTVSTAANAYDHSQQSGNPHGNPHGSRTSDDARDDLALIAAPYSVLQGVEGGEAKLEVENAGFARSVVGGDELAAGDTLTSAKGQRVTLTLSNRFVLILDEKTTVQFGKTGQISHAIRLVKGRVRLVGKKFEGAEADLKKQVFRVLVKTKQAVVGARGTDFLVVADSSTQVTALEGSVEVAKTEGALFSGQGTGVAAGSRVTVNAGGISGTQPAIENAEYMPPKGVNLEGFFNTAVTAGLGVSTPAESETKDSSKGYVGNNAPARPVEDISGATRLTAFQLYWQRAYFQQTTPTTHFNGFGLSWNPTVSVVPNSLELRGQLGLFYGKSDLDAKSVYGLDLKFLVSFEFMSPVLVELGPTFQIWSGHGTQGGLSMNLGGRFARPLAGLIDRIFIGADLLLASVRVGSTSTSNSYTLRAGLGFSF